jgi:hypothetical protein
MRHKNGHETIVVQESIKRTPQGLAFTVRCCDEHEHSVHIQDAHKFHKDLKGLKRVIADHQRRVARDHAGHVAVEAFLKDAAAKSSDCGCP